jgi:Acetyltransferase (GNAT) domain
MTERQFVPANFDPPVAFDHEAFRLRPLDETHNELDYAAWSLSVDHIRATPGWERSTWPDPNMSLEDNRRDLARHARDFRERRGFTYTVLAPGEDQVIGCVYIYPAKGEGAEVHSWVRAENADLDGLLYQAVRRWLEEAWPLESFSYARR